MNSGDVLYFTDPVTFDITVICRFGDCAGYLQDPTKGWMLDYSARALEAGDPMAVLAILMDHLIIDHGMPVGSHPPLVQGMTPARWGLMRPIYGGRK